MPPPLATAIYVIGIVALFVFGRERGRHISWATWIPTIWLLIACSRHVTEWLALGKTVPILSQQQYLEGSPLDASFYAILIAAAIIVLATRRKAVVPILRKNWVIILFVIYCALSVTWSDFPGVALKRWIRSLGDYAMVLVLLTESDRWAAIRTTLARIAFVLLPLSILFIKYYPTMGRANGSHWAVSATMVGVTDNKNMLGLTCLVLGFAALCSVLRTLSQPRRDRFRMLAVHGAVVLMAIYLLLVCQSMTSLSCLVLASGVIVAHSFVRTARKHIILHAMVATVIAGSIAVLFLGMGNGALHDIGRNSTLTGRTAIWAILRTVPVNPYIGTGFESFWLGPRLSHLWTFQILDGITEAHNGYFEMYLNLGLVGDLFIGALLWIGYRRIMRSLDADTYSGHLRLGYWIIAVIYNFTEAGFRSGDVIWFALLLAVMAPMVRPAQPAPRASVPKLVLKNRAATAVKV